MRTVALPLLLLTLVAVASAQTTTYTTTTNGCGAKNIGYCRVPTSSEPSSDVIAVTFDNRSAGGRLQLNYQDGSYVQFRGSYSGFTTVPPGSPKTYYGLGSYSGTVEYDPTGKLPGGTTVSGNLQFYAYWVGTCSGRGCGPVVIGWHYQILSGSTVTQQ
jgi:curli biogenesis system outer membrane secretion channel CsgG